MRFVLFILLLCTNMFAKGVAAGTALINVAELTYQIEGVTHESTSNTLIDIVDQVLNPQIVCQEAREVIVERGEEARVLTFILANHGNGGDRFELNREKNQTSDFVVENPRIYWDSDRNGIFEIHKDSLAMDINLSADEKVTLFFVSDIPEDTSGGKSANGIVARSQISGSGIRGTAVSRGEYMAVDGINGGIDHALCTYSMIGTRLVLQKSQTFLDDTSHRGARVRYAIKATLEGGGSAEGVIIGDQIPVGTRYIADSITLDGEILDDQKAMIGNEVRISLGSMGAGDVHLVTFDVVIE